MATDLSSALRGLDEAAAFARSYRAALTEEYRDLILRLEALAENRPGADKTWVLRLQRSSAALYEQATLVR